MKQKTTFFSILVCLLCFYFSANAQWCGTSTDGKYQWRVETKTNQLVFTFHPIAAIKPVILYPETLFGGGHNAFTQTGTDWVFTYNGSFAANDELKFHYQLLEGGAERPGETFSYLIGQDCLGSTSNIKPEVTLLPAVGGPFTAPASVLLRANATDQDGTITKVEFYNGAVKIGEATSGNADIYSIQWDNVQPGEYTIIAKATDDKLGTTTSNPTTVTVGGEFTNEWCGISVNGDYQWKAETTGSSVIFTIHPAKTVANGINNPGNPGGPGPYAIIYPYSAYMTKVEGTNDLTYTAAGIAPGTNISFYFTYNYYGSENNSSANKEAYTSGTQCAKTLPVSLIDFNSKTQSDGTVSLSWATASESNNSYFLIERSADGKNFSELVKVPSKDGNSTARLDYQFTDKQPLNGNNYYRLSQFDKNGISTELGINTENILSINSMDGIYPNPLKENTFKITVNEQLTTDFVTVSIYNISGKEIYRSLVKPSFGNLQVALPQKPKPGIYIVKAGNTHSFKLLVE